MASPDLSVFQRIKTKQDFDREAEQFQLAKQQAQKSLMGSSPASVQLANEIQKARLSGDTQRLNDLVASAKLLDRGVVYDANNRPMAMGGYGDAIGSIAGAKAGYEQNAKNASDLGYKPQIARDVAIQESQVDLGAKPVENQIERDNKLAEEYQDFLNNRMPGARIKAAQALKTIQTMRGPEGEGLAPDVQSVVGARNILNGAIPGTVDPDNPTLPRIIAGTPAASGAAKIKQAQGQVFLEAYESLRGAGALTNIEGAKGEQAKARLSAAQDEESFNTALKELEEVITTSLNNLDKKEQAARQFLNSQSQGQVQPLYLDQSGELLPPNMGLGNVDDPVPGLDGKPPVVDKAAQAESIFNAKKAIRNGANPDMVRQRLIDNGIDPTQAGL